MQDVAFPVKFTFGTHSNEARSAEKRHLLPVHGAQFHLHVIHGHAVLDVVTSGGFFSAVRLRATVAKICQALIAVIRRLLEFVANFTDNSASGNNGF